VFGKVTNIADYGAFVEIEDGVEGLVHVSEMDWTNKNVNPSKIVQTGEEVEVMVLDVDEERRRISLGLKQCKSNPWKEFAENYNRGDKVSGQVKSITDFGVFIGLAGNIDGLVHLSDISWDVPGEEAVRSYQKGQLIEAMVLSIDPERERISLGIKQLAKDPFSGYITDNPKGSIVPVSSGVDARSRHRLERHEGHLAPPRSRVIASRTRARHSRSATRSRRRSRASIARRASSRCRSRPRKLTRSSRRFRTTRASPVARRRALRSATC
jgi:ribosomal protein S1